MARSGLFTGPDSAAISESVTAELSVVHSYDHSMVQGFDAMNVILEFPDP